MAYGSDTYLMLGQQILEFHCKELQCGLSHSLGTCDRSAGLDAREPQHKVYSRVAFSD